MRRDASGRDIKLRRDETRDEPLHEGIVLEESSLEDDVLRLEFLSEEASGVVIDHIGEAAEEETITLLELRVVPEEGEAGLDVFHQRCWVSLIEGRSDKSKPGAV